MRKIALLFIIILIGCNSKTNSKILESKTEIITHKEPKITGNKYFDYDEIVHYKIEIEEDKLDVLYDNQKKSETDSLKMGIILGEIPTKITGQEFLEQLEYIGYKKTNVNSKKFNEIDKIFTEKKHETVEAYACIYIYRDILIFKKKSEIIGIAKICFSCSDNIILGTESNTEEFGQSGDYKKLNKLLYDK